MWCPGAVIILCAWIGWALYRVWRVWRGREALPVWALVLEALLTPAGVAWLIFFLVVIAVESYRDEQREPDASADQTSFAPAPLSPLAPVLILTRTPLGQLPDYYDAAAIHPHATARVYRYGDDPSLKDIERWKRAVRARGYELWVFDRGTPTEAWEIRVRKSRTSKGSVWA